MPALKRSSQSLYDDEEDSEEEEFGVESARSELRQDNVSPPRSFVNPYTDTRSAKEAKTLNGT